MKTLLSWSSGKDSAWALQKMRLSDDIDVVGLFTTVNGTFNRVAMHGVRLDVAAAQADAAGLPLHVIEIPHPCPNAAYERIMEAFVAERLDEGIEGMAFGDLFLEDIRRYREEKLSGSGIKPIFPIWGSDTRQLAIEMIRSGLKAHIVCIDPARVPVSLLGRVLDESVLMQFPDGVDPCGENGEFHTCVTSGPMFSRSLEVGTGSKVERDGFLFQDLLLCETASELQCGT